MDQVAAPAGGGGGVGGMRWSMTVLTSSSHRAGQGVSQDHFGCLIHHMVLEITLDSHFRLRSHFSENSVRYRLIIYYLRIL